MSLERIIQERIKKEGAISFRDFMEMCLYYNDLGYYSSGRKVFGFAGDYLTAPYISEMFGEILAEQFIEIADLLGRKVVEVVEIGAGEGLIAKQVIRRFMQLDIEYIYNIVEPFEKVRKIQQKTLKGLDVDWYSDMEELDGVEGCIFSNELIDAMPVHIVESTSQGLKEVYVDLGFREVLKEPSERILEYFRTIGVELPAGYRAEVNLDAIDFLKSCTSVLNRGCIITIDYGYSSKNLYSKKRGTLMCYYRHKAHENPYINIGTQDITAHVNFSALKIYGEKFGLRFLGYSDLASFLLNAGAEKVMMEIMKNKGYSSYLKKMQSLKNLIMPQGMGTIFRVLALGKNFDHDLSGFRKPFLREQL